MHLVHVHLQARVPDPVLPTATARLVASQAAPDDAVEHVVAHHGSCDDPVIGVFLSAASRQSALWVAQVVVGRALAAEPPLGDWVLAGAGTPSLAFLDEESRQRQRPNSPG